MGYNLSIIEDEPIEELVTSYFIKLSFTYFMILSKRGPIGMLIEQPLANIMEVISYPLVNLLECQKLLAIF